MCRGKNGCHRHLRPGLSYCSVSGTLHVELAVMDQHAFGGLPEEQQAVDATAAAVVALVNLAGVGDVRTIRITCLTEERWANCG